MACARSNFVWVLALSDYLIEEYKLRYNKETHACQKVVDFIKDNILKIMYLFGNYDGSRVTNFAQAMPDSYKDEQDVVKAYRQYYNNEKRDIATWSKLNNMPDWYER